MDKQQHLDAANGYLTRAWERRPQGEPMSEQERMNLLLSSIAHSLIARTVKKEKPQARLLGG